MTHTEREKERERERKRERGEQSCFRTIIVARLFVTACAYYCFSGVIWKSILLSSPRRRLRLEEVRLMKQSLRNNTLIKSRHWRKVSPQSVREEKLFEGKSLERSGQSEALLPQKIRQQQQQQQQQQRTPPLFSSLIRTLAKKKDFDSSFTLSRSRDERRATVCSFSGIIKKRI